MSPALLKQPFEVASLGSLQIGKATAFSAKGADGNPPLPKGKPWGLPAGLYTAQQIVEANAPLIETCIHHLGPSPPGEPSAREQMLDNLASNLALNTREASISIPTGDAGRAELAKQAVSIGKKLVSYARNITDVEYDPDYIVRSPCEGHLLKPHVSYLMFGPRSLRHLMQIYNEYLHQMILLRDALIPFENYEEVLIPITPGPKRGVRHIEDARAAFLREALTKQVKQRTLLKIAQALLASSLKSQSDVGFQYKAGTILPAFIAGGRSSHLLQYVPVVMDDSVDEMTFHYQFADYYTAKRTTLDLSQDVVITANDPSAASTLSAIVQDDQHQIRLTLQLEDEVLTQIDLGQIARGQRYASRTGARDITVGEEELDESKIFRYEGHAVLAKSEPGLIMPPQGTHIISSKSKIETLALLGKLYPDNVVIMEGGQSIAQALAAGKGGFPDAGRFVIAVGK